MPLSATRASDFRHTEAVPDVPPVASDDAAAGDPDSEPSDDRLDTRLDARLPAVGHGGRSDRRRPPWTALATLLACVAGAVTAWFPTLRVGFAGDDLEGIVRASTADGLSGGSGLYRPVALASLRFDRALWDLNPRGYHVTALVLTGLTAWLVGVLVFRLWADSGADPGADENLRTTARGDDGGDGDGDDGGRGDGRARVGSMLPAAVAAALFIAWPAHAEAVAWIGGRGDLIATACGLGALLTWWMARDDRAAAGDGSWPPGAIRWTVASLVLFVAALGSKESAIVWPLVISTFEVARRWTGSVPNDDAEDDRSGTGGDWWRAAASAWPFYALGAVWWLWRAVRVSDSGGYGAGDLLAGAPVGPIRRWASTVVRSFVPPLPSNAWSVAAGAAVIVVAALIMVVTRRNRPAAGHGSPRAWPVPFLVVALLITAVPGAVLGVSATVSLGERLALLPSVFAVSLTAWGVAALWSARRAVGVGLLGAVGIASVVALVPAQARWIAAGEQAAPLIDSLRALPADQPAVVLVVPDERDGAYVGRNVLPAAVALAGWDNATGIWSALEYRSDGDTRVSTELVGRSEGGGAIHRVTLDGPGARFVTTSPRDATDAVPLIAVDRLSDTEAVVTVGDTPLGAPATTIWTLEGDRIVPAPRR